jgi:mono/diheme cytochrome c family protein
MRFLFVGLAGATALAFAVGAAAMTRQDDRAAPPSSPAPTDSGLPEGEGRALTQQVCGQCHSVGMFASQRHTQDEWNEVIGRMMAKGMTAAEDDLYDVSDYLAANLGKGEAASTGG